MPNKVTVRKDELLQALEENKAGHRAVFERAVDGYRRHALAMLEDEAEQIREGKLLPIKVSLPVPEDHTPDYDRAIRMVTMEVADTIELGEQEFAELVMDDWTWKRQWAATTSSYLVEER